MLDGAGAFTRLRKSWPGVRNMTIIVVIVAILAFTNSSFDLVNILTQGGPVNATSTLIYYITMPRSIMSSSGTPRHCRSFRLRYSR